jgi:tripartite-type tricarboxylate transporter receptor subunit TctC
MNAAAARLLALACAVHAAAALAQYPSRPARMLVGFTPGGGVDINARLAASKLSEYLGQQFVVENRPGAGTNIANEAVAKAAPDGYTLLFNSPAVAINMSLYKNPPYDALRDLAAVSIFSESAKSSSCPRPFRPNR